MGWTHYWQREISSPEDKFKEVLPDFKKILSEIKIELAGASGKGSPVFAETEIIFNGMIGQNCEPFIMRLYEPPRRGRVKTFSYCKTEKLPYDICVQCVLIILKHHLGHLIAVLSDAGESDWLQAKELCQNVLGYGNEFKLEKMLK